MRYEIIHNDNQTFVQRYADYIHYDGQWGGEVKGQFMCVFKQGCYWYRHGNGGLVHQLFGEYGALGPAMIGALPGTVVEAFTDCPTEYELLEAKGWLEPDAFWDAELGAFV